MSHFRGAVSTAIKLRGRRCGVWRPCKRINCVGCNIRQQYYFVNAGAILTKKKGLSLHCTISLCATSSKDVWTSLKSMSFILSKNLTPKIGPFIRTLAIGENKETPHVHYLIQENKSKLFRLLAEKSFPGKNTRIYIDTERVYDTHKLLNYFFTKNYLPTATHPKKIKGLKLMSGSRGMTYGYPRKNHWEHLTLINQEENFVDNSGLNL